MESVNAVVNPSYWQFYLTRGDAEWASDRVSDDGYRDHLECIDGFVYVGTSTYGSPTSVTIEVHDSEPAPMTADRVFEVTLDGEGSMALWDWQPGDGPVARVELPKGLVTLRGSWTGEMAASMSPECEAPAGSPSPEEIRLQLWPRDHRTSSVPR
jgi:hypothetical protein